MTNTCPTLSEFLETARHSFGYLQSEFDFNEVAPSSNEFSVRFANDKTTIEAQGINWGYAVNVLISHNGITVPLWAIAMARGYTTTKLQELIKGNQIAQLSGYAGILRDSAKDVLLGDFSIFSAATEVVEQVHAESQKPKVRWLP